MSTATLERTIFETSRASEYFNAKELQAQTGQPTELFPIVVMKELIDNGLDACETAGTQPEILILATNLVDDEMLLQVWDNGSGLQPETVRRILNFNTRTSDKAAYRSPTRGLQGNAIKTILGIPFALDGNDPVVIRSAGVQHTIKAWVDPAGEVRIEHDEKAWKTGADTWIEVTLPGDTDELDLGHWGQAFSLFNPHALVKIGHYEPESKHANSVKIKITDSYQPTYKFPGWKKFLPTEPTSPWWYDERSLARLVFSHVAAAEKGTGKDLTLREFVRQFRGLSGTRKAKLVCECLRNGDQKTRHLSDIKEEEIDTLLRAMRWATGKAPSPGVLGSIGEDHFRQVFEQRYGVKRFWYRKVSDTLDGIPFVFEAALADTKEPGELFTGINFSPTYEDPFAGTRFAHADISGYGLQGFLSSGHARPGKHEWDTGEDPIPAAAFHLVCPSLEFLDRGKTRVKIPADAVKLLTGALWSVVKDLYREGERRRKDAARQERQDRERERLYKEKETSLIDAVYCVLPESVDHATGGAYPVSARNLYYAVRKFIQQYTHKALDYTYFSQNILTQYQQKHGTIASLYYDPRGVLYEPHTGKAIPVGTREIDAYTFPSWLYNKILYVEKKTPWPIIKAARLAERYDMAVLTAEGYASQAARTLFEHADKEQNYQLFVLHDADPHGYNIARTLREATARMPEYHVDVIDLGLCLEEALEMGLQTEEYTRKKALPAELHLTETERGYFEGRQTGRKSWVCQRVELNAFTAPELVAYIERKLEECCATGKVIPDRESLPEFAQEAYSREVRQSVDQILARLLDIDGMSSEIADRLKDRVLPTDPHDSIQEAFERNRSLSWRNALRDRIEHELEQHHQEIEGAVKRTLQQKGDLR